MSDTGIEDTEDLPDEEDIPKILEFLEQAGADQPQPDPDDEDEVT